MAAPAGTRETDFADFAERVVGGAADESDRSLRLDPRLIRQVAATGLLGSTTDPRYGGLGMDEQAFGRACADIGSWCTATRALLTVQNMVAAAIARWGTADQRDRWLPGLADGSLLAAFCLTEPETGSDAAGVTTELTDAAGTWVVSGRKLWVTLGSVADLYLVIGQVAGAPTAVVLERGTEGLRTEPVGDRLLGMRGAMVAHVDLDGCRVPAANTLGPVGAGFSHVAAVALDHGRHSVAWGSVGIAEGCLRDATRYACTRRQFGRPLAEHQLVRRLLSDMVIRARSARHMCLAAAAARAERRPEAALETMAAKYAASTAAFANATDAVQILGAAGCSTDHAVARFLRDAKVQQIIEGTDEMHQLNVCELAFRDFPVRGTP
ncbi:acyl-CoA dehydrogenase family protein [Streptomyces sp. NPDC050704]|uniref:acyl-CoA dehydrogenase family protein n=1 Tax=Streptomyces sp. NPDC050704 TaxID=3157219 RepID=UPI0034466A00